MAIKEGRIELELPCALTDEEVQSRSRMLGETVWEITKDDLPGIPLFTVQEVSRLANGNTLINNWSGGLAPELVQTGVQLIEVTPDKKVVWALRSWTPPADLGPSTTIQLLNDKDVPEKVTFGDIQ